MARLASEHICFERAASSQDLTVAVFRVTNSVGAPLDVRVPRWTLLVNDLCRQAATTSQMSLRSSGLQWRDFVHIDDVCEAVARSLDPGAVPGGVYNLASGEPVRVRDLAQAVQEAHERLTGTGVALHVPRGGPPATAPVVFSTTKLSDAGLLPRRSVAAAVEETVTFCLRNRDRLPAS